MVVHYMWVADGCTLYGGSRWWYIIWGWQMLAHYMGVADGDTFNGCGKWWHIIWGWQMVVHYMGVADDGTLYEGRKQELMVCKVSLT